MSVQSSESGFIAPQRGLVRRREVGRFVEVLARFRELGILIFLIALIIVITLARPDFLSVRNLRSVVNDVSIVMIVAVGQTLVLISRNVDLSVGSIIGMSGITVGLIFRENPDFPIVAGVALAILIGTVLGFINGSLVAYLRLPSIVATLATLNAYRGLVFLVSGGRQVDPNDIPPALFGLVRPPAFAFLSWLFILALAIVVVGALFLSFHPRGRDIYAIGSNPAAALLRAVKVRQTILLVFTVTGALCGLAGLLWGPRMGTINPSQTGLGFEFLVISATVIGGTSIFGGSGSMFGTLLGCVLLAVIKNGLALAGNEQSAFWEVAIYGALILLALVVDASIQQRLRRAAA